MRMTTKEITKQFVSGRADIGDKASHIKIVERNGHKCFVNYNTVIAAWQGHNLLINDNQYSSTTSKHQNRLKDWAGNNAEIVTAEELYDRLGIEPDWRSF